VTTTIETFDAALPHGITLSCRAAGPRDAPCLMFLHGFPEAAFVWDEVMRALSRSHRCIAPNLRGYERSSAPPDIEAYRAKHVMADLAALVGKMGTGPLAAMVAHDWGGAVAWNLAVQQPQLMQRLVIVNSPHPGTFLRELQHNPAQQQASAYMNFFCRDDAAALLAQNDYARLWQVFAAPDWLSDELKNSYRAVWRSSLQSGLNYYRASPLRPPTADDASLMTLQFPAEFVTVRVPTRVVWGMQDHALLPGLLDGLEEFVPDLHVTRVPGASHWIVHERPQLIVQEIERALGSDQSMT
jgi:pimeloyl-ACP methyl ester carboxylesterase